MREHPIPQDITGYKFHLIGNMTLKQFAEILLGVTIAFIIFKSGLPGVIRWPAALLFAGTGAMAAFVPIEERPLDHWIVTFFKVLFKPTKFFWKRKPKIPDLFSYEPSESNDDSFAEADLSPARKQRVYEFMQSVNYSNEMLDEYDQAEQAVVGQIVSDFDHIKVVAAESELEKSKPSLKVRVRKMQDLSNQQPSLRESVNVYANSLNQPDNNNQPASDLDSPTEPTLQTSITKTSTQEPPALLNPNLPAKTPAQANSQLPAPSKQQFLKPESPAPVTTPVFNGQDQVIGTIFSADNELIPSALVEVLDPSGQIIMAKQTNSLGQFTITQLPPGEYLLKPSIPNSNYASINLNIVDNTPVQLELRPSTETPTTNIS